MAKPQKPPIYPDSARRLRHIQLGDYQTPLFKRPPDVEDIILTCTCEHQFPPPWAEKLPFEFAPIQSADGGRWALSGLELKCPICQRPNTLNFPTPETQRGRTTLFGDEAVEWFRHETLLLYVFAFVSLHIEFYQKLSERMRSLKCLIRPDEDPTSWAFHVKEFRNERWRGRNRITMPIQQVNELLRELATALASPDDRRFISATVFPYLRSSPTESKGQAEQKIRDKTLSAALTHMTDHLTQQGFSIDFVVEAQGDDHKRNSIDFSVERVGRALRHDLTYLYISRCQLIGLPVTDPKGSQLELELADLVAYMVRRHFHCLYIKRQPEVELELLGKVVWGVFVPGRFGTRTAIGFPWDHFYPGTSPGFS